MANLPEDAKKTILEFIADLRRNVFTGSEEQGELLLVQFCFDKLSPSRVIDNVVQHVLPFKAQIQARDKTFFVKEKNSIFAGLPQNRIDHFSSIIAKEPGKGGLSEDDIDSIWAYFSTLCEIAVQYQKKK